VLHTIFNGFFQYVRVGEGVLQNRLIFDEVYPVIVFGGRATFRRTSLVCCLDGRGVIRWGGSVSAAVAAATTVGA